MSETGSTSESGRLEPPHEHGRRRRHSPQWWRTTRRILRRINLRLFAAILIAIILVLAVAGLAFTTDASTRVQASLDNLNRVISTLNKKSGDELTLEDFTRIQASVDDLGNNVAVAQRQTGFLRPFVRVNNNLRVQLDLLDTAQDLTQAADEMLTGMQPALFFMLGSTNPTSILSTSQSPSGIRIVEQLRLGRGQFSSANDHLTVALARINALPLDGLSSAILLNLEYLRNAESKIQQINSLLIDAPDLLNTAMGLSSPQNYLVLSQNSDELRPSGGYISTYGWLTVRNGRVTDYDYGATSNVSPHAPPTDIASPYPVPPWWIHYAEPMLATWDGSWSPDFPTTAAMAKWFYDSGHNPQAPVSGVIGIDLIGFQYLLNALGNVTVPEYNETVTPENFRATVYDIREHGEGDSPHKRFLAAFYKQIFNTWQSVSDPQVNQKLLNAVIQGLMEKHIMIYLPDEHLNNAVDVLGWSGKQDTTTDHDYLMAVDANLGNKSNSSVVRQLTYDVEIKSDGALNSRATVYYDYPAALADKDPAVDPPINGPRDYPNLLQLFTPQGTALSNFQGLDVSPKPEVIGVHNVLVSQFIVPYNSSQSLQFSYTVPSAIEPYGPYQRYRLLVQKQPGTHSDALSVQVTLPKGATSIFTSPTPTASYQLDQPVIEFQLSLKTDQWIEVIYHESS